MRVASNCRLDRRAALLPEEGGGECEHLTVCLTVPKFGKPGESLRVTQLDGSQFLVRIPLSAAAPEAKFLAHFPCKPMREAARRHLAGEAELKGRGGLLPFLFDWRRACQRYFPGLFSFFFF